MPDEAKAANMEEANVLTRRSILAKGAIGMGVAGMVGSEFASTAVAATVKHSRRTDRARAGRTILWVVDCVGAWNLQIDVGFHDAAKLTGWTYKKVGSPCAQAGPTSNV